MLKDLCALISIGIMMAGIFAISLPAETVVRQARVNAAPLAIAEAR